MWLEEMSDQARLLHLRRARHFPFIIAALGVFSTNPSIRINCIHPVGAPSFGRFFFFSSDDQDLLIRSGVDCIPGGSSRWDTRRQRFPNASDAESSPSGNTAQHNRSLPRRPQTAPLQSSIRAFARQSRGTNRRNILSAVTDI